MEEDELGTQRVISHAQYVTFLDLARSDECKGIWAHEHLPRRHCHPVAVGLVADIDHTGVTGRVNMCKSHGCT